MNLWLGTKHFLHMVNEEASCVLYAGCQVPQKSGELLGSLRSLCFCIRPCMEQQGLWAAISSSSRSCRGRSSLGEGGSVGTPCFYVPAYLSLVCKPVAYRWWGNLCNLERQEGLGAYAHPIWLVNFIVKCSSGSSHCMLVKWGGRETGVGIACFVQYSLLQQRSCLNMQLEDRDIRFKGEMSLWISIGQKRPLRSKGLKSILGGSGFVPALPVR